MENKKQENTSEIPDIINLTEPHLAILFLLDTSKSIGDDSLGFLNEALNRFKTQVCENIQPRVCFDVAIVEFNSNYRVVQAFVPVEHMDLVNIKTTDGGTNILPVIRKALEILKERLRFYMMYGTQAYRPMIILVTDGNLNDTYTDLVSVGQEIQSMEDNHRLRFISLKVGSCDSEVLHLLSGQKVLKLVGTNFYDFFGWILSYIDCFVGQGHPVGEEIRIPVLPDNVIIDRKT
jgi:uncharacterized protein YegL